MSTISPSLVLEPVNTAPVVPIDLDAVDAVQLARSLANQAGEPLPQLLVDCGALKCQRTLGVSHLVSQLLVLHRSGARVWLRNASPALQRCLQLLRLDQLFLVAQ